MTLNHRKNISNKNCSKGSPQYHFIDIFYYSRAKPASRTILRNLKSEFLPVQLKMDQSTNGSHDQTALTSMRRCMSLSKEPTAFKELQMSVSVMKELDVIISWRVGMLLFLPNGTDKNQKTRQRKVTLLKHTTSYTLMSGEEEKKINIALMSLCCPG